MNNFELARRFYKDEERKILACKRNEWAFAPYAWNAFVNMTPIELAIWEKIRNVNAVFYPQYPVLRYFADFANPVAKIAIECDGAAFHHDKEKDAKRDAEFESIGWIVYRLPGYVCMDESDEHTGESGNAEKCIRLIADHHGLIRNKVGSGDKKEATNELIEFLLRVNTYC